MEAAYFFVFGMIAGMVLLAIVLAVVLDDDKPNPWHDGNESPKNKTHVLAFKDGRYVVMFYRDAMYEDKYGFYLVNRVDRWMYIPGNTKSRKDQR